MAKPKTLIPQRSGTPVPALESDYSLKLMNKLMEANPQPREQEAGPQPREQSVRRAQEVPTEGVPTEQQVL